MQAEGEQAQKSWRGNMPSMEPEEASEHKWDGIEITQIVGASQIDPPT